MNKFTDYKTEDFVLEEKFCQWVVSPNVEQDRFWAAFLATHPHQAQSVQEARLIVFSLQSKSKEMELTGAQAGQSLLVFNSRLQQLVNQEGKVVKMMPNAGSRIVKTFYWAAAIAILVSFGSLALLYLKPTDKAAETVAKKVAGQWLITNNTNMAVKVVVLEDGSRISLQPNSQLKYPVQFGPGQREVVLQGGAFFEIARNKQKPFLVQTAHLTIKVLGTSFAVSAYQESARAEEVSVKTGKVSVITKPEQGQPATSARQMELTPNQRAVFDQTKHELVKGLVAIPLPVVKLEKSRFIFDNVALGNVFALIEEVYQVKIVLEDKSVAQCPLTAALTEESLYVKLDLICKSIGASYEVRDTQILIKGTGCNEN